MRIALLSVAFLLVAACGPDKPASDESNANTQPSATATATSEPAGGATSGEVSRGVDALKSGDYATAKSAFEAAIAKNPRDADAHHYLAVTLEKTNDKAGAEREYKAALAIRPNLAEAAANLGALYVDGQKWDEAIAVLEPEAKKRGDSAPVEFNLALAYAGKGDRAGATRAFDAAMKITPSDAMLLYTYGHTLASWHEGEQAVAKLRAAAGAANGQGDLLGSIGHELLVLRAVPDCIAAFDKAIAAKDAAQFRTERALCKLANKDDPGATSDLEAALKDDPNYGLAHYWLATRRMAAKKWSDAAKELEAYLKLEPTGPKAKSAQAALAVAKRGGREIAYDSRVLALLATMKKAWLAAALFVVVLPIGLGPGTSNVTRWLGGEPEHACMCGMKRGTCGCPECERLEAERRADARVSKLVTVHRTCERDDGTVPAPELPVGAPSVAGIDVAPAPSHEDGYQRVRWLLSQLAGEPSTPPPRA